VFGQKSLCLSLAIIKGLDYLESEDYFIPEDCSDSCAKPLDFDGVFSIKQ
jgi:hypothetical protein